jgi:hypothetical protein
MKLLRVFYWVLAAVLALFLIVAVIELAFRDRSTLLDLLTAGFF